jgi:hypothetical protein
MEATYRRTVKWYKEQTKPIYFAKHQEDIPASIPFPRIQIQEFFGKPGKPFRYFTCSLSWLIAFAIMEGFERIELWGVEIAKRKPAYAWERPCTFYWIVEAQRRGIDVWWPEHLDWDFSEAGDPNTYEGPLYGFGTKPEPDWVEKY